MWALTGFEEKLHLLIAIARITDLSEIREAGMTIRSERGLLMHVEINRLCHINIIALHRASIEYEREERK